MSKFSITLISNLVLSPFDENVNNVSIIFSLDLHAFHVQFFLNVIKSAVSWHPYLGHLESFNSNSIPRKTSLVGPLRVKSSVRSMIFQVNLSLVGSFFIDIVIRKSCSGESFNSNADDQNYLFE